MLLPFGPDELENVEQPISEVKELIRQYEDADQTNNELISADSPSVADTSVILPQRAMTPEALKQHLINKQIKPGTGLYGRRAKSADKLRQTRKVKNKLASQSRKQNRG